MIDDARSLGADRFVAIGDLAAIGPDPVAVLERLTSLEKLTAVRGNTDRFLLKLRKPG